MIRRAAPLVLTALLAGCALRSGEVAPLLTDPAAFAAWRCEAIDDELDRVRLRATRVAYSFDERAGSNIVALGLGVTVFWPALVAMRPNGIDGEELARLKGRDEALLQARAAKGCAPASAALPPERAAALPVAPGERLVYEERAGAGGPMRQLALRVQSLRREGIEFLAEADATAPAQAWPQDSFGNQGNAAPYQGWVTWRRLLVPDLALGAVLSGDVVGADAVTYGRLRGQVIALGVQNSLGRPFDAAVIELFGDVPAGGGSTRLTGVMVVDRKSGVLLRLELHSGNAEFALRRTLARIEAAR